MTRPASRTLDVVVAGVALVVTAPVQAAAAAWIALVSRGPVLYLHTRHGLGGSTFTMLKFRTMRVGAHAAGSTTVRHDDRIIPGGRFLRAAKIDELPQLVNVLRGDMALVGPRPMVPDDHERLDERQRRRDDVRPGITGLAQINGGTGVSWPRRLEHDLAYVEQAGLALDLQILARTLVQVLSGRASVDPPSGDEWADPEVAARG